MDYHLSVRECSCQMVCAVCRSALWLSTDKPLISTQRFLCFLTFSIYFHIPEILPAIPALSWCHTSGLHKELDGPGSDRGGRAGAVGNIYWCWGRKNKFEKKRATSKTPINRRSSERMREKVQEAHKKREKTRGNTTNWQRMKGTRRLEYTRKERANMTHRGKTLKITKTTSPKPTSGLRLRHCPLRHVDIQNVHCLMYLRCKVVCVRQVEQWRT